jgi:imidazole glycerol phosphate synthase glutamine amidotransferase subunit
VSEVTIVDTGVANLASVLAAFRRLGVSTGIACDAAGIERASRLVLPGVGAFGTAMHALRSGGMDVAIGEAVDRKTPLLAICLGMQLLCDASEESPGMPGLGIITGTCRRLPSGERVPHLGWNLVTPEPASRCLTRMHAAFANSFALLEAPAGWAAAWTRHGTPFVAGVERDSVVATQFHPELSGPAGASLIRYWLTGARHAAPARAERAGLSVRVVPCLDVLDGRVVKGVRFEKLRDIGDPAVLASRYEAQGADEIVVLDIGAAPNQRAHQDVTVAQVRDVLGIPLTAGGGVRSVADARRLLAAGADKVSVNSAAVARPALLTEMAASFGSQCVVLAIDARRSPVGWEVLVRGGRDAVDRDAAAWAREGTQRGAGEILLTSWDRDGTRSGCDLDLVRAVSSVVNVPVIASGGIGLSDDAVSAVNAGADAILAASILHDGQATVGALKNAMSARGVPVRA